jgi:plasmid stabilization system protein ParE
VSRRTVFRPAAVGEAEAARQWYEDRLPALGEAFVDALEATVGRIEANPLAYPMAHGELRRALLRGFPYAVIYRVSDAELLVVAVVHERRDPRRWRGRR